MSPYRRPTSRREELAEARRSRRPSRLGTAAGTAPRPDFVLAPDAGFPGLLAQVWKQATAAPTLSEAVGTLLTLGGHVPADIQLRALRPAEETAIKVLCGATWRDGGRRLRPAPEPDGRPAFLGELGLTASGRVAVSVPSRGPLASEERLVDGVLRVPWSHQALSAFRDEMSQAAARLSRSVTDCRNWLTSLDAGGRDEVIEQLKQAALRTAPFVLHQDGRQYTNFRDRNTLTGKTLWPGHPDCALSRLRGLPLELWSDNDVLMVTCLALLVRSAGYARIEEANGTQLTVEHVAELLERTRHKYNRAAPGAEIAPAVSQQVASLMDLAGRIQARRVEIVPFTPFYREIHGPLMHKIERIAGAPGHTAHQREREICARLRERLPLTGDTLAELGSDLSRSPSWLAAPAAGFETGLEALVYETVSAAGAVFAADFAMSRGMRSLPRLIDALRAEDWTGIIGWELPEFFCCVVPAPDARRHFGNSRARLADTAWSMSARMQYNSWHFLAGNLPKVPEVEARDYFAPPSVPDIAYYSDQHHHGHVATRVRFSIRSPQAVEILGRTFKGFVDLRLLRCEGPPFGEQDLLAAHRTSAFISRATGLAADAAGSGADIEVTAFDPDWHWAAIAGSPAPASGTE